MSDHTQVATKRPNPYLSVIHIHDKAECMERWADDLMKATSLLSCVPGSLQSLMIHLSQAQHTTGLLQVSVPSCIRISILIRAHVELSRTTRSSGQSGPHRPRSSKVGTLVVSSRFYQSSVVPEPSTLVCNWTPSLHT